jgi:glycosyltransferase A (GT-A) superfamily protein (DUF2064 family)
VGVLVVAKAPVPGQVKTRLAADLGAHAAASLAAAALLDTLDLVESVTGPDDRMLSLSGDLAAACEHGELAARLANWLVRPQRGATFADRLVAAHRDAVDAWGAGRTVVQIGMDTPALTTRDLALLAARAGPGRVGLGPAPDGGWWGLATPSVEYVEGLVDVPMSTRDTCRLTRTSMEARGATVVEVHTLTDVDRLRDAYEVSRRAPTTRFARRFAEVVDGRGAA